MQTKVKAWGNSQGIRLPKSVLKEAEFSVDDLLDIRISRGSVTLVKVHRHRSLEERAEEYGGRLELDGEYDWGQKLGRESWE